MLTEKLKDSLLNKDIYFLNEELPMKMKALGKRFAVCTRELDKEEDRALLEFEVERGTYYSFKEAYEALKDDVVYSCIDFEEMRKAPHNMIFNNWDFRNQEDIESLLNDLESGEVELSGRNYCALLIDFDKTLKNV